MNTLYSLVAAAMFKQAGLSDKELEHRSPLHFWPWLAKKHVQYDKAFQKKVKSGNSLFFPGAGVAGVAGGALFHGLSQEAKIPAAALAALGIGGSIAALHLTAHFNKKRVARELAEKRAKKAEQ